MTKIPRRAAIAGLALASFASVTPFGGTPVAAVSGGSGTPQVVVRATDSNSTQYAGGTSSPHVSPDGRWLGFSVPNGGSYVKDLLSGTTTLVSLNADGDPANGPSAVLGLSLDASKVLFSTAATNMPGGAATASDLYVRDRLFGLTTRVNYPAGSSTPVAAQFGLGSMDDFGMTVAFTSAGVNHVYRRTLNPGVTEQVDVSSAEVAGNAVGSQPAVSATGRFVTFTSSATNLVAGDTNAVADIFERDTQAGTTTRVSLGDNGQSDQGSSWSSVNTDGTKVAFMSDADNLVGGDANVSPDVFERDLATASTFLVSQASDGTKGNGSSGYPEVSADGRFVAFQSSATAFDPPPATSATDIFLRDVQEGFTTRVGDVNAPNNVPNAASSNVSMTSDASGIAFFSSASNLVGPGEDTNAAPDAFIARSEMVGPWPTLTDYVHEMVSVFGGSAATEAQRVLAIRYGKLTPTHLVNVLAHDPAWAVDREPVARLYQAFFLRRPDAGGLDYWVKKHAAGVKLSKIAASFAGSSEFKTKYGNTTNSAFVTLVYSNVLQRKPDAAGLTHWVKKLDAGTSRGDIMVAFSESSEGKRFLATWVDATLIGIGLFHGKVPDQATYDSAVAARSIFRVVEGSVFSYLSSVSYANAQPTFP